MKPQTMFAIAALFFATSAASQTSNDDWTVVAQPAEDALFAVVTYDTGVTLQAQCVDGLFDLFIGGPAIASVGNAADGDFTTSAAPTARRWGWRPEQAVLGAHSPARAAREIAASDILTLGVPGSNSDRPVVALPLPTSVSGLHSVLRACSHPIEDPRDTLQAVNELIVDRPTLPPPPPSLRHDRMDTGISCIVVAGRLSDCQIDWQSPRDARVARTMLRDLEKVTLNLSNVAAAEGRLFEVDISSWREHRR